MMHDACEDYRLQFDCAIIQSQALVDLTMQLRGCPLVCSLMSPLLFACLSDVPVHPLESGPGSAVVDCTAAECTPLCRCAKATAHRLVYSESVSYFLRGFDV